MIAVLAALALAGAAQAQVEVQDNFPAAMNGQALSAWLRAETDVPPEQVVAVSPSAATAIVERHAGQDGRTQVRLRAVAITRQAVARGGVLAWEMQLDVDCKSRQVRAGATTGYATRRGGGDGLALAPADEAWRKPKAGAVLEASWRAVCDARFQSPLTGGPLQVAAVPAGRAAETPAPRPLTIASSAPAHAPPEPPPATQPSLTPVTPAARKAAPAPAAPRLTAANVPLPAPPAPREAAKPAPQRAKAAPAAPPRPRPVRTAAKAGPNAVQVVSSPKETDTRKKLDRLQRRFGSALQDGVEIRVIEAQVGGQKVYRGVVAGFATRREARAFCQTLKQGGQDCVSW